MPSRWPPERWPRPSRRSGSQPISWRAGGMRWRMLRPACCDGSTGACSWSGRSPRTCTPRPPNSCKPNPHCCARTVQGRLYICAISAHPRHTGADHDPARGRNGFFAKLARQGLCEAGGRRLGGARRQRSFLGRVHCSGAGAAEISEGSLTARTEALEGALNAICDLAALHVPGDCRGPAAAAGVRYRYWLCRTRLIAMSLLGSRVGGPWSRFALCFGLGS